MQLFQYSGLFEMKAQELRRDALRLQTAALCGVASTGFLGGLSLHLNHLIESRLANYNWPFGTLPFGLFGSNLDTRDFETYSRTYSGHF